MYYSTKQKSKQPHSRKVSTGIVAELPGQRASHSNFMIAVERGGEGGANAYKYRRNLFILCAALEYDMNCLGMSSPGLALPTTTLVWPRHLPSSGNIQV